MKLNYYFFQKNIYSFRNKFICAINSKYYSKKFFLYIICISTHQIQLHSLKISLVSTLSIISQNCSGVMGNAPSAYN